MDSAIENLVDISQSEPAALRARADLILERATWASQVFQRYDRERTQAIADAVAEVAHAKAGAYGEWAVRETGFGVAEHKKLKNELSSIPLVDHYRSWDFVNPRSDAQTGIVEVPKPAGVVFALVPSTNPISTIYFKVLTALMTRNAIVISPHPAARESSIDAAHTLARAAEQAGAPEATIQVIEADQPAPDRRVHAFRQDGCHSGHRRDADGPCGLFLVEPGHRRRAGKRPGAGRYHRRPEGRRRPYHRQQVVRQFGPVHQ